MGGIGLWSFCIFPHRTELGLPVDLLGTQCIVPDYLTSFNSNSNVIAALTVCEVTPWPPRGPGPVPTIIPRCLLTTEASHCASLPVSLHNELKFNSGAAKFNPTEIILVSKINITHWLPPCLGSGACNGQIMKTSTRYMNSWRVSENFNTGMDWFYCSRGIISNLFQP